MVERHRQPEFKRQLAARIRIEWREGEESLPTVLASVDKRMAAAAGDSVWNYWPSVKTFRQYLRDNDDDLTAICTQITDSETEWVIEHVSRLLYGGETTEGGQGEGSGQRAELLGGDELTSDEAILRDEDVEYVTRCLAAYIDEREKTPREKWPDLLRRYARTIALSLTD